MMNASDLKEQAGGRHFPVAFNQPRLNLFIWIVTIYFGDSALGKCEAEPMIPIWLLGK